MKFYVAKRPGTPYNGPTWDLIGIKEPFFFHDKYVAEEYARYLAKQNPVGFHVESIEEVHPGFIAGEYPLLKCGNNCENGYIESSEYDEELERWEVINCPVCNK